MPVRSLVPRLSEMSPVLAVLVAEADAEHRALGNALDLGAAGPAFMGDGPSGRKRRDGAAHQLVIPSGVASDNTTYMILI